MDGVLRSHGLHVEHAVGKVLRQVLPFYMSCLLRTRAGLGDWLALVGDRSTHGAGVGLVEVTHFDHLGHYARGTQARLANPK